MLTTYTPTMPVPTDSSAHYVNGWLYADWYLLTGGAANADSPDGWHEEKYEGWWDRLAEAKRTSCAH